MTDNNDARTITKNLTDLDIQRRQLDTESSTIIHELTSSPGPGIEPIGIDAPLVDAEGYPRSDIDLYHATALRKRLVEIRGDYKTVMGQIERGLVGFGGTTTISNNETETKARLEKKPKPKFDPISKKWVVRNSDGSVAGIENGHLRSFDQIGSSSDQEQEQIRRQLRQADTDNTATSNASSSRTIAQSQAELREAEEKKLRPFAIIDDVFPESPADEAGLRVGDLILRFGTADHGNHRDLKAIADIVPEASLESRSIPIVALRCKDEEVVGLEDIIDVDVHDRDLWNTVRMKLLPKLWSGRGLLGCHLKQI